MLKKEYWLIEYLSISQTIRESRSQYDRAFLHSEQDDQDITYFLHFNLKVICSAIKRLKEYLAERRRKTSALLSMFERFPEFNFRQRELVQHALRDPGKLYSILLHKNYHGVAYQTARTDLLQLADANIMDKIKVGKEFYFSLNKNIEKAL